MTSAYYGLGVGLGGAPSLIRGSHVAVGGLLDQYRNASSAYSLRRLRSDYTGDVVKVRRESDNAEKGFTASAISSGALVDFVNANGTQFMNFDGTDDDITTPALLPATDDFTLTIVAFIESTPSSPMGIFGSAASGTGRHVVQLNTNGTVQFFADNLGGAAITTSTIIEKSINTIVVTRTGQTFEISLNGGGAVSRTAPTSPVVLTTANNNIGDPYFGVNFQGVITSLSVGSTTWDGTIANVPAGSTVNGSPSTNALNDGFVTIWYDQSGNSKNATQDVAANQPLIVENGSLLTDSGGRPEIQFDGTSHHFDVNFGSDLDQPNSFFLVHQSDTTTPNKNRFFDREGTSVNPRTLFAQIDTNYRMLAQSSGDTGVALDTNKTLVVALFNGSSSVLTKNGTAGSLFNSGIQGINQNSEIGRSDGSNGNYDGTMQEFIIYNANQSSVQTAIETNIANHYGITLS